MKKRAPLALLLAVILIVSLLSACGNSSGANSAGSGQGGASTGSKANSDDKVNLRFMWWGGETRHKATVEALNLYMERNPNITIEFEYGGFSGYFDKLLTQLAGNSAPDIVQLSYTNVSEYVVRNQLYPMDDFIQNGTLSVDKLDKTLLDTYNINDMQYAIPAGINIQLLYYNKTVFDDLGIEYPASGMTFDEVYAKADEVTKAARAKHINDLWGISTYGKNFDVNYQRMLVDQGGKMWSDDLKTAAFNSPQGIAALQYIKKPIDEGYGVPPEVTVSNPDGLTDFALGNSAMEIDNATSAAGLASTGSFELGVELSPFGNSKKAIWYQASQVFSITKQTKNAQEAAKVIDFLINDPDAGKILAYERGIPVNEDIRVASAEGKSDLDLRVLELVENAGQYVGDGTPTGFPPGYMEVYNEFNRLQEAYHYNQATAETTLEELEKFANQTIGKFS